MKVELIDHMGQDLSVANAARVSFDKWSELDEFNNLKPGDEKLIEYLATHDHWSPFAHSFLSFRISAPLFVCGQLSKHQIGLAWNQVSGRYVQTSNKYFIPENWRKKVKDKKQGSSETEFVEYFLNTGAPITDHYKQVCDLAIETYKNMINSGVCEEQARMILPQSIYTSFIWSGSLYAFVRVCKLRLKKDAQYETRQIAKQIYTFTKSKFPVSIKYLLAAKELDEPV